MKSYQVLKLQNVHLATREKCSIILDVIIAISGIMFFYQSRVNVDCLPGNFSLTLSIYCRRVPVRCHRLCELYPVCDA